jgi:hypothetical protein
MTKTREYLTRTKQCEERAHKTRCSENRDCHLLLARAYRRLAEFEQERAQPAAAR